MPRLGHDPSSTALSRDMHAELRELQKVTQQIESQWRILVVQENSSKRDVEEESRADRGGLRPVQSFGEIKSRENRRQAEERDRDELMQRVTSDDEFRLLVGQYDAEAELEVRTAKECSPHTTTRNSQLSVPTQTTVSLQRSGGMIDDP